MECFNISTIEYQEISWIKIKGGDQGRVGGAKAQKNLGGGDFISKSPPPPINLVRR